MELGLYLLFLRDERGTLITWCDNELLIEQTASAIANAFLALSLGVLNRNPLLFNRHHCRRLLAERSIQNFTRTFTIEHVSSEYWSSVRRDFFFVFLIALYPSAARLSYAHSSIAGKVLELLSPTLIDFLWQLLSY